MASLASNFRSAAYSRGWRPLVNNEGKISHEGPGLDGFGHRFEKLDHQYLDRRRRAGLIGRPRLNSGGHTAPRTGKQGATNQSPEIEAAREVAGDTPPSQIAASPSLPAEASTTAIGPNIRASSDAGRETSK